jgi:hypothetical protein
MERIVKHQNALQTSLMSDIRGSQQALDSCYTRAIDKSSYKHCFIAYREVPVKDPDTNKQFSVWQSLSMLGRND